MCIINHPQEFLRAVKLCQENSGRRAANLAFSEKKYRMFENQLKKFLKKRSKKKKKSGYLWTSTA